MNSNEKQKVTLISGILNTIDSLAQEEIGLRIGFEMARQRPQINDRVAADTTNKETALKQKQIEILQFEQVIELVTGRTVDEIRAIYDELQVLAGRRAEIQQETTNRRLLSPALIEALAGQEGEDSEELRTSAKKALDEVPRLEAHIAVLTTAITALIDKVNYGENKIQVVSSLVL